MNKTIKNIGFATFLIFSNMIFAQKGSFFVSVQAGTNKIEDNTSFITDSGAFSGSLKAGYIYKLNNVFGVGTGVEFMQYKQNVTIENDRYTSVLVDDTGSAFEFNQETAEYSESQTLNSFQIPLFIQYKKELTETNSFYFRLGGKLLIPSKFKINTVAKSLTTTGYYPDFNLEVTDVPSRGFGTQSNFQATNTYKTKLAYMASIELGFDFKLNAVNSIYFGMFLDYGLSNIVDNKESNSIVTYNPSGLPNNANGVYSFKNDIETKSLNFGVTLGYSFGK
ncbi:MULTISPECIES: hypothetical protein [Flavobacterium]|uniref:Outer membrane protein beta-barrel domain-containing protein n=1 Tax=Flavobacterium jumunjinense TaxID=998845 RepID=A0ABV5GNK7_9FLAO|nr:MULTISPECIES: hypothetical protein [Flavobacterium]